MKVVFQGDGEVYSVVGEEELYWILCDEPHEGVYPVLKTQCVVLTEGESPLMREGYEGLMTNKGEGIYEELVANMAEENKKHNHYYKDVSEFYYVDVYRVCDLFGVDDKSGAIHHAIKKLLCSGVRGVKGKQQDVQEAVDTLNRWIEMQGE